MFAQAEEMVGKTPSENMQPSMPKLTHKGITDSDHCGIVSVGHTDAPPHLGAAQSSDQPNPTQPNLHPISSKPRPDTDGCVHPSGHSMAVVECNDLVDALIQLFAIPFALKGRYCEGNRMAQFVLSVIVLDPLHDILFAMECSRAFDGCRVIRVRSS
mmetsp:Transcript_899/g.2543  ORF Transcript_899/g.2543 Transcript_899/m.2543 type:complete len:157 (-) Transcript_899:130-600(-)